MTNADIQAALGRFDRGQSMATDEIALFCLRNQKTGLSWYWKFDALIYWRRGNVSCALTSWRHAIRLTAQQGLAGQTQVAA